MSLTGQIISAAPYRGRGAVGNDWIIDFTYITDAGQPAQQGRVIVGSDALPFNLSPLLNANPPLVPFWSSPTATITVSPNPPGTTNPVVLACPGFE